MKKVYFVRHGQDDCGPDGNIHHNNDTPLTELGLQQAKAVAKRFRSIPVDKIISSTQERSRQTVELIAQSLGKDNVEYSELFIERRRPSCVRGKDKRDPEVEEIDKLIKKNFHNLGWHHSDEENFLDLKTRAEKAIEFLDGLAEDNLLVVTSGVFLRMLASCVFHGEKLTSYAYHDFFLATTHANTGITVFEKAPWRDESARWRLVTWNDHSHLPPQ